MVRRETLLAKRKKKKQEKNEKKRELALSISCVCSELAEVGRCYFDLLPFELIREVLFKLLIEDLIRCKSVCQTWYNLITDSDFIKSHMERALCQPRRILLAPQLGYGYHLVDPAQTRSNTFFLINKEKCTKISDAYLDLEDKYKIAGSCNGLLCLASYSADEPVLIYNPINRESQALPEQRWKRSISQGPLYGFGFDPLGQKYKVVCVYRDGEGVTLVEIITEGEACWRRLEIPFQVQFQYMPETVFVHEAFHWIIDREEEYFRGNSCPELILALHIGDEKFRTFCFPPVEFPESLSIINCAESLAVAESNRLDSKARIWKIVGTGTHDQLLYPYTCEFESKTNQFWYYHRVLGMLSNGCFVYKAMKGEGDDLDSYELYIHLALYNPEEKQSLIFKLCDFNNTSRTYGTFNTVLFTPTLVSPKTIYFPNMTGELEGCQSEPDTYGYENSWISWSYFDLREPESESDESVSSNFSMKYILRKGQAVRKRQGRKGRRKGMERRRGKST